VTLISDHPPGEPPAPRVAWGYFATFGWALLTYIIANAAALAGLYFWDPEAFPTNLDFSTVMSDSRFVSVTTILANLVQVGLLLAIIGLGGWRAKIYLAMTWPPLREVKTALAFLAVTILAIDAAAYLLGQPIIPPFMSDVYQSALTTGTMPLLWLAIVVAAPVAEEIIFRGFLFRGWARPQSNPWLGIVLVSAVFTILHMQYNWFGLLGVLAIGLLLTWIRWRTGSMLLPMLMHFIANFYAMLQVTVFIHWLS
jgi:uncharacterized protein